MMKGLLLSFVCIVAIYCACSNAESLDIVLKAQYNTYWTKVTTHTNAYNTIMGANSHDQITVFVFTENFEAASYSYLIVEGAYDLNSLYEPLALRTLISLSTPATNNDNNHQALAFTRVGEGLYINDYISNEGSLVLNKQIVCDNGVIIVIDQSGPHLSPPTNSIYEQLPITTAKNLSFKTLQALINVAGVTPYVNFNTSKTVFAPSDDAFAALFATNPVLLPYFTQGLNQTNTLSNLHSILATHIVDRTIFATDVTSATSVPNEAGTELIVTPPVNWNVSSLTVTDNSTKTTANVIQANILTNGGVIHAIDTVFIPSNFNLPLSEVLRTINSTKFSAAVNKKGIQSYLSEGTLYTIFVPVDSALSGVDPTVDNLLYHFVESLDLSFNSVTANTVANSSVQNFGSQKLYLTTIGDQKLVNGIKVQNATPYKSSKGTQVYLIDSVIPFPSSLKDTLSTNSTFRSLLEDGHISSRIYNLDQANTTVFVPSDAAFDALLPGVVGYWSLNTTEATDNVVSVLNNHIIPASNDGAIYVFSQGSTTYKNANGQDLEVIKTRNSTRVNVLATVTEGPIITSGGSAFTVDSVILPSGYSLTAHQTLEGFSGYEKGSPYGTYETFLRLMRNVDLDNVLNSVGNYDHYVTIFAPNDDAFMKTEDTDNYENRTEILRAILFNHVSLTDVGLGLNKTGIQIPVGGNNSGVPDYITVTKDGKNPVVELYKAGQPSGTANVILETRGTKAIIYGIDRVLGVSQKGGGSSHSGLKTWQIIAIAVGGGLLGLLLLAVLIGAVYYLVLRPKSGYRKIN